MSNINHTDPKFSINEVFISIVIPSYNEENHIANCIRSIESCKYPKEKYEIILVDNGSSDNTVRIADHFNVKILIDGNKSIGGLRNLGCKNAIGDILGFLDADCIVSPDWLGIAEQVLEDKKIGITGSRLKAPESGNWIEKSWALHLLSRSRDGDVKYINSGNCFVRRKVFDTVGGFSETLETNEDVDLCKRVKALGYSIYHCEKISAIHLGYPRTIKQFFKREIWHGVGDSKRNMHCFWKSKPALLSFYNIIIITMLLLFAVIKSPPLILSSVILFFLPAALLASLLCLETKAFQYFPGLFALYSLYGIARAVSFLRVIIQNMVGMFFNKSLRF